MHYREFGRTGIKVSALGMGCMRLPVLDGDAGRIDRERAIPLIRLAAELGINYFDTAWPYHGGQSESLLGEALAGGLRERVFIATKLPSWEVAKTADFDRFLDEQLKRLQTDHIDFYLLHALNAGSWANLRDLGVLAFLERARLDGRIRFAGFSFHDVYASFEGIVDAADWDFCMIQFNYLDEAFQAGVRGLEYAAVRGIGVAVMEPLRGGYLARPQPPAVQAVWDRMPSHRSPAEWALRWVWNWPEVTLALSGMGDEDMLRENCHIASEAIPYSLTDDEREAINMVRDIYRERMRVGCTACNYCMPCPHGVRIPDVFLQYNEYYLHDNGEWVRNMYGLLDAKSRAGACVGCGVCVPKCPQSIPISELMPEVARVLGG